MDQAAKAKFILALHKHSLQAFDSGGTVSNGLIPGGVPFLGTGVPATAKGIASDFTTQNGFQAGMAPTAHTNYGGTIDAASGNSLAGYGQAQNIQAQQQDLANQLSAQSMGQGPNPAQAALAQSTGQNVAAQGSLMAGQRGASVNPALIARQAAQQGASTQQQAVGQSATLQAQQQLAAQSALQQQQALMGGQNIQEQGVQNQLYGTSVAGQNTQNANDITNFGNAQGINAQVSQNNANAVNKTEGGLLSGVSSALGAGIFAEGGDVTKHPSLVDMWMNKKKYADGGSVAAPSNVTLAGGQGVDISGMGGGKKPSTASAGPADPGGGMAAQDAGPVGGMGMPTGIAPMAAKGGKVVAGKGEKAVKKDNSYANDKVPAILSQNEIVLPRSITMHPNAPERAADFVRSVLAQRNAKAGVK